jgi:AcrR family transcriptional regulator
VFSLQNGQNAAMAMPTSAPKTARDRVRDEVTREILETARTHLARDGAAALALRSIARDLGMAPSALYRYFNGRDALLSALILGAYESLADAAQQAAESAQEQGPDAVRWLAVPRAMRVWALDHPHEWGLIFGSPVPGYEAPQETVVPYARLATALVQPLVEAQNQGRLNPSTLVVGPEVTAALAPVIEGLLPEADPATVTLAMGAWTTLIGSISLELFGHWRHTILDPELFFEVTMADLAAHLGMGMQP